MSAALRARYRRWYFDQRAMSIDASDEDWSPVFEGLHWWHRLRIRRMYGRSL